MKNVRLLLHNTFDTWIYISLPQTNLSREMTPQTTYRRHYGGPEHATYHMLEYTAIFPSQSAAVHERLKHLHRISCLCQSSLVTHRQSESEFHPKICGGPVTTWLLEPVRGRLAECWTPADGAVQCCCGHVAEECQSLRLNVCCERPRGSTVSTPRRDGGFLMLQR